MSSVRGGRRLLVVGAFVIVGVAGAAVVAGATSPLPTSALPPVAFDQQPGSPQPTPGTSGRIGPGFAAMPSGQSAVLYGGGNVFDDGPGMNDTWVWNGSSWTKECGGRAPCAPGARDFLGAATVANGVLLYGGQTVDSHGTKTVFGDSWLWNGNDWQRICATCGPGLRTGPAMAGNGKIALLFGGGRLSGSSGLRVDTWEFNGTSWELVDSGNDGGPAPRIGASMAWDGTHFVLFGGLSPTGNASTARSDTWIWTGSHWVEKCGVPMPACGPRGRILGGFASLARPASLPRPASSAEPAPILRGALLEGGIGFSGAGTSDADFLNDVWFWSGVHWEKLASPWPVSTPAGNSSTPPLGMPVAGALAAMPASCEVVFASDYVGRTAGHVKIASGVWRVGFDADHDARPDGCPVADPTTTTATTTTTVAIDPAPVLPVTGSNSTPAVVIALVALAAGLALLLVSRRGDRHTR